MSLRGAQRRGNPVQELPTAYKPVRLYRLPIRGRRGHIPVLQITKRTIYFIQKGRFPLNLLFFLTPKSSCSYLYDDYTLRQALERMEHSGYTALPILSRSGEYRGTLTEGDLLWAVKNLCCMDLRDTEEHGIMSISHRRDNLPVSVSTDMQELLLKATDQNFVPVVDDKGAFIGIVTRRAIMRYCLEQYIAPQLAEAR